MHELSRLVEKAKKEGVEGAKAQPRCWAMLDELTEKIGKETPERLRAFRLVSAAYFLQHPQKLKTPYAALIHLGKICYLLANKTACNGNRKYQDWLVERSSMFPVPEIPEFKGDLTITSLFENNVAIYDLEKIEAWAESVWKAYGKSHAIASQALSAC